MLRDKRKPKECIFYLSMSVEGETGKILSITHEMSMPLES